MNKKITTKMSRRDLIRLYQDVWGAPVIPFSPNKIPMVPWAKYRSSKPTEAELRTWFDTPYCHQRGISPWGIGFVCGAVAGNLFSIDIDSQALFDELKQRGAFPTGACIYKSAKGYHVVMRSSTIPYSVKEHSDALIAINPLFDQLGISGEGALSIAPDTPGRQWIQLYNEPAIVDYEAWLGKYIGWTEGATRTLIKSQGSDKSNWIAILCPWHENDGKQHTPSCNVDLIGRGYKCWGCGREGKLSELTAYARQIGYVLPKEITEIDAKYNNSKEVNMPDRILYEVGERVSEEQLPEALIEGIAWRGDIGMLYGVPGSGKSSYMTSGAADLMSGQPLWGDWGTPRPLRVLYLDCENPPGETRLAIQSAIGKGGRIPKGSLVAELTGKGFDVSNPKWQQWLEEQIKKYHFDTVIGDNLGKMTVKNIIDDFEMRRVVNILRSLVRKHNILFLLVHHTGWQRYDNQGRQLPAHGKGGSSLQEDVNFCFEVTRVNKLTTRIKVHKIRSRRAGITVGDELVHYYDLKLMKIVPAELRKVASKVKWLVDEFGVQGLADKLDCNKSTISRYLHCYRQPEDSILAKIEELAKATGYRPRLTDVV